MSAHRSSCYSRLVSESKVGMLHVGDSQLRCSGSTHGTAQCRTLWWIRCPFLGAFGQGQVLMKLEKRMLDRLADDERQCQD
jgi:hypothetical protein